MTRYARKFVFTYAEHKEYDGYGWKPDWFQVGDPVQGMGVAHDVLEHLHSHDGTFEDEMLAFGAMYFVRAEMGYFERFPWSLNVASDVHHMAMDHEGAGGKPWLPTEHTKGRVRLEDFIEEDFEAAMIKSRKEVREESGQAAARFYLSEANAEKLKRLWRQGYRTARHKYGTARQYELLDAFRQIEKEADRLLKHAELGDKLHVRITRNPLEYEVKMTEYEYY